VESLAHHKPFFMGSIAEPLLEAYLSKGGASSNALTGRERQVVQLIAEGHVNKKVAKLLGISLKTVETHRSSAMRKMNATSAVTLVRYAIRNKLIEP